MYINAAQWGKVLAVMMGALNDLDMSPYMSDADGLRAGWFDLAGFNANATGLTNKEDWLTADSIPIKEDHFCTHANFNLCIISKIEDKAELMQAVAKIPNFEKLVKICIE